MKSTTHLIPASLALLAQLFERLDRSPRAPDGGQYREVALRLAREINQTADADAVQALLAASPAAAELYENLHYAHAGLCRSPLDAALAAERLAGAAIDHARRPARQTPPAAARRDGPDSI